jgi:ribonuclease J
LQRLAAALNPRKLVPIHTEHGEDFTHIFANVVTLNDGEIFDLV